MVQVRKNVQRSPNLIDRRGTPQREVVAARAKMRADVAAGRAGGPGTVDASLLKPAGKPNPNTQGRKAISAQMFGFTAQAGNPNRSPIIQGTGNRAVNPQRTGRGMNESLHAAVVRNAGGPRRGRAGGK